MLIHVVDVVGNLVVRARVFAQGFPIAPREQVAERVFVFGRGSGGLHYALFFSAAKQKRSIACATPSLSLLPVT